MAEKASQNSPALIGKPGFTIFDALHLVLPLTVAGGVFLAIGRSLGWVLGMTLAALAAVLAFWLLRYVIPASVVYLYRRRLGTPILRQEVACYVVTHFPVTKKEGSDENKA